MQYNSETNSLDLYSDAREWCGIDYLTDTTSLTLKSFTRSANFALDRCTSLILRADGRWQHDDTNNTSTEILDVTTNLASGTKKYATSVTWLKVNGVRIKDSAGTFINLPQKDRRNYTPSQLTDTGTPTSYDLLGNWVYLSPTPNYASTGGLEIQYQRGASYFTTSDTTKTPGFATHFHRLISLHGALDYCEINDLDSRAVKIRTKIGSPPTERDVGSGLEMELVNHYATRNVDDRPAISVRGEDYGQGALSSDSGFTTKPDGF